MARFFLRSYSFELLRECLRGLVAAAGGCELRHDVALASYRR
jgi:hypothetical protein